MEKSIKLKFVKEAKNTIRYEDEEKTGSLFRDTLYIAKDMVEGIPEEILVTISSKV